MAKIYPFRSLRYAPDKVPLAKVVTQPYDKISREMQERYYAAHVNNIVRVVFGKTDPSDSPQNNVYTRAAAYLKEWRASGILQQLPEPALFVYFQRWTITDHEKIRFIQGQMEDKKLIIADGHHRYETALAYRDEMRGAKGSERIPMTFFNMHGPGLSILPTHRVLANVPGFDSRSLFNRAAEFFDAAESSNRDRVTIGVFTDGRLSFFRLKESLDLRFRLPDFSERQPPL